MKLNHVNLTVSDVPAAANFLETYFDLKSMGGNAGMMFLTDGDGFVLTLMKAGRNVTVDYPGMFHIGFFVADEATVDRINLRLREDGFDVAPTRAPPRLWLLCAGAGRISVELGA